MKILNLFFVLSFPIYVIAQQGVSSWVNPIIGTGGHGHTFPGPVWPFGMVQLSPDTRIDGSWDGCSGYHYSDSLIYGFSHTHLSGTGCSDWGDVMIMPVSGTPQYDSKNYRSSFSHKTETAKAGYYSCTLTKYQIRAELTVTPRVGIHQYVFLNTKASQGIMVDLNHRDALRDAHLRMKDSVTVVGYRRSQAWAKDQIVFFCIRFSKPIQRMAFDAKTIISDVSASDSRLRQAVFYVANDAKPLVLKVGISAVSIDGALQNIEQEAPHWNFETYKKQCVQEWNRELSAVNIQAQDSAQYPVFYTALYHAYIHPSLYMDVDGQYRGRDGHIHKSNGFTNYTVFSLWDTYRTLHPLLTLLQPQRTRDFLNSFLHQYRNGGRLPIWELSGNETDCMIGFHAVSVIADAAVKGLSINDSLELLQAAVKASNDPRFGIPQFNKQGFLQSDDESESISKTLEYAYDNWCIAQLANRYHQIPTYNNHLARAAAYKHIFDPSCGFMRPRKNGSWLKPFRANEINNHFTEGNSWQYSFYVPHDIIGLSNLYKSTSAFELQLHKMFTDSSGLSGREQADVTGLLGQYAHGNEPSHHAAYLFHFLGKPFYSTQRVHQICNTMYKNSPDGLIGNDDCGQMSAWYVMSALGLYPFCPGSDQYVIIPPIVSSYTLNLPNSNLLNVQSHYTSALYVQPTFNSKPYLKSYINHSQLMQGGLWQWHSASHQQWGQLPEHRPVSSMNTESVIPAPVIESSKNIFKDSITVALKQIQAIPLLSMYTSDTTKPFQVYTKALQFDTNIRIWAQTISNNHKSPIVSAGFYKLKSNADISILTQPNVQYQANGSMSLIDGIKGTADWRKGDWLGFQGKDVTLTFDLKSHKRITNLALGVLQDTRSWIVFPKSIEVWGSTDNAAFTLMGTYKPKTSIEQLDALRETWVLNLNSTQRFRYVKLIAKQYGTLPQWHPGAGGDTFIFIDECEIQY